MTTTNQVAATGITWDLSEAFAERYRGKINVPGGPPPDLLLKALQDYEDLHERTGRASAYAHLLYDTDTRDATSRDLVQKVEQRTTELRNLTLFFDLEWL